MMKKFFVSLFALLYSAVAVSAGACQTVTLTFNMKPKFPGANGGSYVCGDIEKQEIEAMIKAKLNSILAEYGLTQVSLANMKVDSACPTYLCDENPGHKCLPFCIDAQICGITDLSAFLVSSITDEQIEAIQMQAIDDVRAHLPDCLGIKNQFMLDLHKTMRSMM